MTRSSLTLAASLAALAAAGCNQPAETPAAPPAAPAATTASTPAAATAPIEGTVSTNAVPVTVEEVRAMVARDGATAAVQALDQPGPNGGTRWETVTNGIASGQQQWLDLFPLVGPGTDAGTSTGIAYAMSMALTSSNAAGALRLMTNDEAAAGFCDSPLIEPTPQQSREFYSRAIAAVTAVNDPALAQRRAVCINTLEAGRRRDGAT